MMVELLIFDCLVLRREDIMESLGVAKVQLKNGLVNLSTILFRDDTHSVWCDSNNGAYYSKRLER